MEPTPSPCILFLNYRHSIKTITYNKLVQGAFFYEQEISRHKVLERSTISTLRCVVARDLSTARRARDEGDS